MVLHSPRRDGRTAHSRREVLRLVSLGVGMVAALPLLAACAQSAPTPALTPTGSSSVTPTAIASIPTAVSPTNTLEPTEVPPTPTTAPVTATPIPSPTSVDTATAVPATNTPKAESSPTPDAKPVLANYAVYSDNRTLVIADLPPDKAHPTAPHEVFVYQAIEGFGPDIFAAINTGNNSFRTVDPIDGGDHGYVRIISAERNDKAGILSGEIKIGSHNISFKLPKKGSGLLTTLHACEAVKTIALQLGPGGFIPDDTMLTQINDELFRRYNGNINKNLVYLHP